MLGENDRKFFEPMWRRVALMVVVAIWSAIEWYFGEAFWGTLTLGILAYGAWTLFITFKPVTDENGKD